MSKIEDGTKVRATIGDTTIVGTVQNFGSSFPMTSILIDGAHGAYLDCWDTDGWKIEAVKEVRELVSA